MSELEVQGFDELIRALQRMPEIARPIARQAMAQSLALVVGILRPYPPQPARDRAGTPNTYVRGIGFFPRASFEAGERKKRGAYEAGKRGGKVRRVSERLGEKWTWEVEEDTGALVGIVGNLASYSEIVQGRKQPAFHRRTGWTTVDEAVIQAEPQIVQRFEKARDEVVEALANE
jgi:hypothetical protein